MVDGQSVSVLLHELEKLASDLRDFSSGKSPSEADLRASPGLHQWSYGFVPAPCLVARSCDLPMLGNRSRVHTSQLVMIDPDKRWARTWSKLYRLGEQQAESCDIK